MKRIAFILFALLVASVAHADDQYYYLITGTNGDVADGVHYPTPDAACRVMYPQLEAALTQELEGPDETVAPSPYTSPTLIYSEPPNTALYDCEATATVTYLVDGSTQTFTNDDTISQAGDNCTDAQTYNPSTGLCEDPTDDQSRKELGDSDSAQVTGGAIVCKSVGDPINAAVGNVFESETDYQDADGELRFVRYYNSGPGYWTHSYSTLLVAGDNVLQIYFDDGHSSLFKVNNNVATAEPTELGRIDQVNGQWVYTSPANEKFTFNTSGHLVKYQQANGLAQTLAYTTNPDNSGSVTVTDSRGHTMTWNTSTYGLATQLAAGDLTVAYTWNVTPQYTYQLTGVAKTRANHTSTRIYAYGDSNNDALLTGVTDERGIAYSSWSYDTQGRATSSQHAGGADLTTVSYNSDGTSTVTNALGHGVTFTYQVIQGVKRVTSIAGQPTASCPASNSSFAYTTSGQVQTQTDALGHVTAYTYDTLGREITRVEAQGTPQVRTITTTWNPTWPYLRQTVSTSDRTTTYGYDSQGRPTSTTVHDNKE
ncbi:DUF6531 domain-containing protein [Rhodanobacter sp. DHG33]|uniref:DUF6531 domain-containing protein n=1 Tax=Rhodanobacter sp. DHG33 TaxID=2775921 RepID=UPI00177B3EAC|nr:DUF6531 domain-containing protein [Rhodanobacter sp. DHG33]MBD8898978.1 RHS repeat protein [Rhodanobacter sp. DHG33]